MIGKSLGSYSVTGTLGKGGMGEVYLARDVRLDRTVAVKVLPEALARDPERRERFMREARSASALKHPNVAHVYDVGDVDGVSFIVMEHIEGETLAKRLSSRRLPVDEAIDIATQVADALADAHARGITHRDVKPSNVMITDRGLVKVLDFGLARFADPDQGDTDSQLATVSSIRDDASELTRAGLLLGTIPYMSPEQARGEPVDPRSDVFSVGVVLYEMLTGARPFHGATQQDTVREILRGTPTDVVALYPELSPEVAQVVRTCLEPSRQRRYPSADALRIALHRLRADGSPAAASAPPTSKEREKPIARLRSVAVLPFENPSAEESIAYLCDGLAERLIASLSRVDELRVMSRHATFALRDAPRDIAALGERLRVESLLLGELRLRGSHLVVNVELVAVPDGSLIWGERYDRPLDDATRVERDVVSNVSRQIGHAISSSGGSDPSRDVVDPQAYLLYLKGRSLMIGSAEQMTRAGEYLLDATRNDPDYALAHATLAEAYVLQAFHAVLGVADAQRLARASARRAMELEPDLPEAHVVDGMIRETFDWDFEGAEKAFQRAMASAPGRDGPYYEYAEFLTMVGRSREALTYAERARELDPVSPAPTHMAAFCMMLVGDYDAAIAAFKDAIALHPDWIWGHIKLARTYLLNGQPDLALAEVALAEAGLKGRGTPLARSWLGHIYGATGEVEKAERELEELDRDPTGNADPAHRGAVLTGLGRVDEALDAYEDAVGRRSPLSSHLLVVTQLAPKHRLAEHPRMRALLGRVGIPGFEGTAPDERVS